MECHKPQMEHCKRELVENILDSYQDLLERQLFDIALSDMNPLGTPV